ncbi:MAG: DNA-directed RNA polymerase subunit omega [Oscillibacter sp.]|nr:DNA-directed RNA polymerase subunit omega [Oscillibacter sp.]
MMLYPAMGELSAQIHNRYMLVNVVARRARQIAEAYENAHQILEEKPVTMAIHEVADGLLEDPEQALEALEETEPDTDPEPVEPNAE